jgi:hypothetical protein
MSSLKILRISLTTAILLLAFLAYRSTVLAHSSSSALSPSALSPYIEIWDDTADNDSPVVAYSPQFAEYMVVWSTIQGPLTTDVWARRVLIDGSLSTSFNIDSSAAVRYVRPAIAYSPPQQEYLVAFTDSTDSNNTDIYGRTFIWNGGSRSSRIEIDINTLNQDNPAIAYNPLKNEFLIVYQSYNSSTTTDIIGRRYRLSDHTLLPAVTIASSAIAHYRSSPDVAYNPARDTYFITYILEDLSSGLDVSIAGLSASSDLTNLSSEVTVSNGLSQYVDTAITAGKDGYLVVYSTLSYIYGRLVSGEGVPLGATNGFPIPNAPAKEFYRNPDVSFLGTSTYLVTWDYFDPFSLDAGDVFAQYVSAKTGDLRGPNILLDTNPHWDFYPSAACSASGACLIAYEHNAISYPGGDIDIRGRIASLFKIYLPLTEK